MSPLVLRLTQSGQAMGWIDWQEAALYYAKEQIAWTLGDTPVRYYGGMNRARNEKSYMDIHPIIAVHGDKGRGLRMKVPPLTNRELFRRDNHTCMYCLQRFSDRHLTRDHVVPVSRGGINTWRNVVCACRLCNEKKSDYLLSQLSMTLHAVPYEPNHAEWLILRNRNILADQMAFLKAQCPKDRRDSV